MKKSAIEKRFFFHANAVALAGHIVRPDDFFIPAVASSCLPVTGGMGKADWEGANFGDILSYGSASTSVTGDFIDKVKAVEYSHGNHGENDLRTETTATARVTGLKVANGKRLLEIDSLEATMSAISDRQNPTEFRTLTANYQGIRVDGIGLKITTHCELFAQYSTKEKLVRVFEEDKDFRGRCADYFFTDKPAGWLRQKRLQADGIIYGTVVSQLEWDGKSPRDVVATGNSIQITDFGSIYFGEILIEEDFRRLTLLRFQLGCPQGGSGSAVEVQTNGTSWPPRIVKK